MLEIIEKMKEVEERDYHSPGMKTHGISIVSTMIVSCISQMWEIFLKEFP